MAGLVFTLILGQVFVFGQLPSQPNINDFPYGRTSVVSINTQNQEVYIESVEKISPLKRSLWQSPLENYKMYKELGWGDNE